MGPLQPAWLAMAEALLIGLLVGVEREADTTQRHAGLRDFITIGLAGGVCGLLGVAWLTSTALIAVTALVAVFRVQTPERTGITTELAAVATFLLCVVTTTPGLQWGAPLGIGVAVVYTLTLEMRQAMRKFFVQVITEQEFHDTLRFLAVVFVVLPILPDVNVGPYGFFNPHKVWLFVILICFMSWLGYFLQKFLGEGQGLLAAALLGGMASTTASTTELAKECAADPQHPEAYVQATLLSNAVQGPRILILLMISAPALARFCLPALAAMTLTGVALAFLLGRRHEENKAAPAQMVLTNPLRLTPALQFGALFAAIRFFSAFGVAELGVRGVYLTSAIAGSVDADSVVFSMSGLMRENKLGEWPAAVSVIIAIAANFVLKAVVGWKTAPGLFARRITLGFALMTAAAAACIFMHF